MIDIKKDIVKNLSREQIIKMSIRDNEKPMGILLTYIKDMYGLGKIKGFKIADTILSMYKIENKMYN